MDISLQLDADPDPSNRPELMATLTFHTLAAVRWAGSPGGILVRDGASAHRWDGVAGQKFRCVHGHAMKLVKSAQTAGVSVLLRADRVKL